MSPNRVLLTAVGAGSAAAVLLPPDRPGAGWALTAVVVFALVRKVRPGWAAMSVALFATGTLITSGWLFVLCVFAGCAAASLAVAGGTTAHGVLLGSIAVSTGTLRGVPWLFRALRANGAPPMTRPVLVTVVLLVIFVPLLAGADATFAEMLESAVPDEAVGGPIVLFLTVGLATVGACFLIASPPSLDSSSTLPRRFARRDWGLPVGALVVLFAAFVGFQVTALFGGDDYVLRTAGLTYAEYARRGFWQLLAVTVLTLGVVAVTARFARVETDVDRKWLRGLLGALSVLTLVIVASALARMWFYQQAYGFTVLRVLVATCELWLGVVYLLVLAAGVRLRARWLAQAVLGTGFAALVGLALLNPERFIAERNIARWQESGRIDLAYLARLSDDAVPAIATLPDGMRRCALRNREIKDDDWRSWNLARDQAREALRSGDRGQCVR
ncbi:hypothetical protein FHS29_006928 [Saccharothrix tamanrassetensis]|uniref:DUF4173 domain-containing protein n=1 Tax=Saccharothrix tamanrassetensis TaxID=1051531 RepID=A0A841CWH2_9PSEU|nr:DUF4173 domain-containing protein [Saccharothrix tamanrassetensis]MBB5960305.1 hypothetical protein [Saccharothrix tamanrassetensis]